jgi:hypothetical protein
MNSAAMSYAQQALNEVPGRSRIASDHDSALRDLADAVEYLAQGMMELARRQS